jgi:hypothetical protein
MQCKGVLLPRSEAHKMWHSNKILNRARISLILLLLISVRLVPFNLLHYHNNQFASFDLFSDAVSHQSATETISNDAPYCTFHQFLSLTSNGFLFEHDNEIVEPVIDDRGSTEIIGLSSALLLFDILNKGSPLLV